MESKLMARSLSPFTRITLLLGELNKHQIQDLTDNTKCDLIHHTSKLAEEIEDTEQKQSAFEISEQGQSLFSTIKSGDFPTAEAERKMLITNCKKLKALL